MVEKIDEKTMCLETVKAIDLRQRKTRYRVWIGTSIVIAVGVLAFVAWIYMQFYISLKDLVGTESFFEFEQSSSYFVCVLLIGPIAVFFILMFIIICIQGYLYKLYFPKEESDQK